jgi:hypothetical protein
VARMGEREKLCHTLERNVKQRGQGIDDRITLQEFLGTTNSPFFLHMARTSNAEWEQGRGRAVREGMGCCWGWIRYNYLRGSVITTDSRRLSKPRLFACQ